VAAKPRKLGAISGVVQRLIVQQNQLLNVAEEAVSSEPVSGSDSLLNRENTGNFGELAVNRRHITSNLLDFSIGYEANSLTIGTGNFWQETGKQCG
jgi:hypothetical protein